jgi:hypothetical protein
MHPTVSSPQEPERQPNDFMRSTVGGKVSKSSVLQVIIGNFYEKYLLGVYLSEKSKLPVVTTNRKHLGVADRLEWVVIITGYRDEVYNLKGNVFGVTPSQNCCGLLKQA